MRLFLGAALAAATLAMPAQAMGTDYYEVTPTTAPAKPSVVTRDILWHCDGGVCTAARSNSSAKIVCQLAARELGTLSQFSAKGEAFDANALAKCNKQAR